MEKQEPDLEFSICRSRIAVVEVKWQYFKLRGSGGDIYDTTSILNLHLNSKTAKKLITGVTGGAIRCSRGVQEIL